VEPSRPVDTGIRAVGKSPGGNRNSRTSRANTPPPLNPGEIRFKVFWNRRQVPPKAQVNGKLQNVTSGLAVVLNRQNKFRRIFRARGTTAGDICAFDLALMPQLFPVCSVDRVGKPRYEGGADCRYEGGNRLKDH